MRRALILLAMRCLVSAPAGGQTPPPQRLSLTEAITLASRSNVFAVTAAYQADQADARIRQRRAALLPWISASTVESGRTSNTATFGFDFPSQPGQPPLFDPDGEILGPVNTLDVRARVSERLFDPGARARVRTATTAAEASRSRAGLAAEDAGALAGFAYLQVQRAAAVLGARQADSVLADSLIRIAEDRLEAGSSVALDVTRARAQAAGIRAQLIAARTTLAREHLSLAHVLGLPVETPLLLTDSLTEPTGGPARLDLDSLIQSAMATRPDVAAAEAALRATSQSIAATRAERLPSLEVFGDYGLLGRNGRSYLGTYLWGIAVTVPIFNGFEREGRIDEDQARLLELQRRRQDLADQVALEVRTASLDLSAAFEALSATRDRLDLVAAEARQAAERFEAGLDSNAAVITALLALNGARVTHIDALTAFHRSRVALARARGAVTELPLP
jgi:outer membrane protein